MSPVALPLNLAATIPRFLTECTPTQNMHVHLRVPSKKEMYKLAPSILIGLVQSNGLV